MNALPAMLAFLDKLPGFWNNEYGLRTFLGSRGSRRVRGVIISRPTSSVRRAEQRHRALALINKGILS
jgi:hypothetical protein